MRERKREKSPIETVAIEDVFVVSIAKIEDLGCNVRLWLCTPEEMPGGESVEVVKAKLVVPKDALAAWAHCLVVSAPMVRVGARPRLPN